MYKPDDEILVEGIYYKIKLLIKRVQGDENLIMKRSAMQE